MMKEKLRFIAHRCKNGSAIVIDTGVKPHRIVYTVLSKSLAHRRAKELNENLHELEKGP